MNPNRMGLEEQTEAHALLARAANHPDWRVASHALDELMRRRLVLHRLLEAEERLAPPDACKRSHGWQSQKLTSLTLLLALIWSFASHLPRWRPLRHLLGTTIILPLGMPGRPVADSG